jgi:hypothetical protein
MISIKADKENEFKGNKFYEWNYVQSTKISSVNESFKESKEKYYQENSVIINAPIHDEDDLNGIYG